MQNILIKAPFPTWQNSEIYIDKYLSIHMYTCTYMHTHIHLIFTSGKDNLETVAYVISDAIC